MKAGANIDTDPLSAPSVRLPGENTPLWLVLAFLAALSWRALNSLYGDTFYDGYAYIMTARNILAGHWDTPYLCRGIVSHYQPLYPLLIAAVSLLTRDLFSSARLVNILAGSLLVFPVFGFARDAFGRRAAIYAAFLLVINPELVRSSSNAFSEPVYVLAGLTGAWLIWRALDRDSWLWLAAGTVMLALATLARAQGVSAFISVLLGFMAVRLIARRDALRRSLAMTLAAAALFFVIVIPSFRYLERDEDRAQVGGKIAQEIYKKPRVYRDPEWLIGERTLAASGLKLSWIDQAAHYGPLGPIRREPGEYLRWVLRDLLFFTATVCTDPFLPPLLLLPVGTLLVLDLARRKLRGGLLVYILAILAGAVFSLALIAPEVERYVQLAVPLFLVLAGGGMAEAEPVIAARLRELKVPRIAVAAMPWLFIVASLTLYNQPPLASYTQPVQRDQIYRQAAAWLRPMLDPTRPEIIMAVRPAVPAYTGDYFYLLPLDSPERVANYARAQQADFILTEDWYFDKLSAPQREAWLQDDLSRWGLERLGETGLATPSGKFVRMKLFAVEKAIGAPGLRSK